MTRAPVIMLVGPARSGKDTAGAVFAQKLGGTTLALADPIKRFLKHGYGLVDEQLWGDLKETPCVPEVKGGVNDLVDAFDEALGDAYLDDHDLCDEISIQIREWAEKLPKKTTPRHMMQTFGTECVREIDPDFWIDYGLYLSDQILLGLAKYDRRYGLTDEPDMNGKELNAVVITDGRFRNEMLPIRRANGYVFRVERPMTLNPGAQTQVGGIKFKLSKDSETPVKVIAESAQKHQSETEQLSIPRWWYDGVLVNQHTLEAFQSRVELVAGDINRTFLIEA